MSLADDKMAYKMMKSLGVKWPRKRCLPTYPATMTDEQRLQADKFYDSMSEEFINSFGAKHD